jgi:hypothetical protein
VGDYYENALHCSAIRIALPVGMQLHTAIRLFGDSHQRLGYNGHPGKALGGGIKVAQNPQAVGYGGIAYGADLVHCNINGVSPTEENVRNETYPIARYLYFYTIDKPQSMVKAFIDWVLSKEGQRVVKKVGYIPLIEISYSEAMAAGR